MVKTSSSGIGLAMLIPVAVSQTYYRRFKKAPL
jgi:hypothetical protein